MYRRPKFLEVLLEIRQQMAREADYDIDLFAEMVRSGKFPVNDKKFRLTEKKTEEDFHSDSTKNRKLQIANRK
jgi:hypothetical protein